MLLIQLNAANFRIPRDASHRDQAGRKPAAGTRKSGLRPARFVPSAKHRVFSSPAWRVHRILKGKYLALMVS